MRRLGPFLVLVLIASTMTSLTADAGSAEQAAQKQQRRGGPPATSFNTPRPWGSPAAQSTIVRRVERAINATRPTKRHPKPTITIASFLLDHSGSVSALIGACRRGVGVRVVLDKDIVSGNSRRLISALNGDNVTDKNRDGKPDKKPATGRCGKKKKRHRDARFDSRLDRRAVVEGGEGLQLLTRRAAKASLNLPTGDQFSWGRDRSYVKKCRGGCRNAGDGGNMHSKFYVFSRTGKAKHVVMVSSSNLNRGGMTAGWNDMYVMRNRPKTYKFYLQVHRAMTRQLRAGKARLAVADGPFVSRFFPMRGAGQKADPTLADLKQIRCSSRLGRTQIHVSMFYWKGTRGNYLTSRLFDLARQGCAVSVVFGAPSRQMSGRLKAAARVGLINLYDSRWDMNEDGYNEVRTHAKFVAVKGTYRGDRSAWVVMTGSQNWVGGSLSLGDENTLNVSLRSAYDAYRREWSRIVSHSKKLPLYS